MKIAFKICKPPVTSLGTTVSNFDGNGAIEMPAADTFHATMAEALAEAQRRKAEPAGKEMVIRVEPSRYGGFRVKSTPSDLYIDQLTDGPLMSGASLTNYMVGA